MPWNEPARDYRPGDPETQSLKQELAHQLKREIEIPLILNGREVRTGKTKNLTLPHAHRHSLGVYHQAGAPEVELAISGALSAWKEWSETPPDFRASIFLKAADLLTSKHRDILNAATMLGQSKTCHQAEIDSACELIDFFRFNVYFQEQLQSIQPLSPSGISNRLEYRPLEGFVFAVTPFNFSSIAGNLPSSVALMGNTVVWKPASTAVYSGYFIMKLLEESGLPPGVIQFLPGSGEIIGERVMRDPRLAGIHFTGSTAVFHNMWKTAGENIAHYKSYPRIVGETGGKDFIFAHGSSDIDVLATAIIRGAFEYQGQKCSAASRAYIPKSIWPQLKEILKTQVDEIPMGDVTDFQNFMGAVIDKNSFEKIKGYIESAKKSSSCEIIVGGQCSEETGYFIRPTLIETKDPHYRTMCEEIFGPVLTLFVYEDSRFEETLENCDTTSVYALTGSIIAQDKKAIEIATRKLRHSAGNFYINNKPTGAVVGQQPFGGGRASGTNDKAGSLFNLNRWTSLRTVSETHTPPKSYPYPFMEKG